MSKLIKVESVVKKILEENKVARDDDFILLVRVYAALRPDVVNKSFGSVMLHHKEYMIPSFESVSRSRRKLQADNEELRSSKRVQDARLDETAEYINYAIDGYNPTFRKMIDSKE